MRGGSSVKFSRDIKPYPIALLGLLCLSAQADELDTLQFYASENVQHDSNPFRLSDSSNAQTLIGTQSRSDTIAVTTLGFKLNKPIGLQRFEFDANIEDHRYKRFTNLDFTGINYAAAWRWSFTPALHGNLTSDRREYVDNTADVQINGQGVGQSNLNRRTASSTLLDAEYEIDGAWRALGGVFERVSTSSQPTFEGDSKVRGLEVGARRVFSSGTSLAYRFRNGRGNYSDLLSVAPVGEFKDREHEVRLDWAPSGKTTVQARLAYFDRAHDGLSARDFSGAVGQADVIWAVTGKTSVTWGAARELGSYQTTTSSYYQGYRFFVAPTWRATEKIAVRLRYDHGVRDYRGALPGFAAIDRKDKTRLASLALEWQAARALKLAASVQRDKRTSNDPRFDYVSNSVGVLAQLSF
ncbi:MAG: putative exosortase B-associated extracellular polysaccharide biosynthesis transporter EpsL [Polaromonas sp.]|nr:putative exosortase B-associated extracellular polysaccharide biosynthesis transporter EpsL [Polaromonas sp.]